MKFQKNKCIQMSKIKSNSTADTNQYNKIKQDIAISLLKRKFKDIRNKSIDNNQSIDK